MEFTIEFSRCTAIFDVRSLSYLFKKYNCEIIVISEIGSEKLDSQEIFEEIVSLLHCYSKKLYSKRKIQKIKEVLSENE